MTPHHTTPHHTSLYKKLFIYLITTMASSFLMSPSCCETTATGGGPVDPLTQFSTAQLFLPFPTNNYNSSFASNQAPFCSLQKHTEPYAPFTPYDLINTASSTSYDISVFILSDANSAYPNSSCFKRKYETSDFTLSGGLGYVYVEYPTQQPYEIRIIVTQKCGYGCEVVPSEFTKKRKMIFSKLMPAGFAPYDIYNVRNDEWHNKYSNPALVNCSELNIPTF